MPVTGNNHNLQENILSIQANLNGFSFCVSNRSGEILASEYYTYTISDYNDLDDEVHQIFRRDTRLRTAYSRCVCLFVSDKSTLIPADLFNAQHLRSYLEFVTPLDDLDEIHYRHLNSPDAMAVFALPSPLAAAVSMYQPNVQFYHQSIPLIKQLNELRPYNGARLHLSDNMVSMVLYVEGRLVLSNTYQTHAFTDTMYFLGYALKQWNLRPDQVPIYLSGELPEGSEEMMRNYYPSLAMMHEYQILHTLHSCEL